MARPPRSNQAITAISALASRADRSLAELVRHAETLLRLENLLKRHVGSVLENQFQVAAVRQNRLILISPSASSATRLKMMADQMLDCLRDNGFDTINHIDLRVAPLSGRETETRRSKTPSSAARKALDAMSAVLEKPTKSPDGG
jgi:hypothetical protein